MAIVLALVAAVSWGASDFLGGLAGREGDDRAWLPVTATTQILGLLALTPLAFLVGADSVPVADLWWGAGAGVFGALGVSMLYRGLAIGRMSIVAPITAVGAAALPIGWGVVIGELPSALASAGVVLALVAIYTVSRVEGEQDDEDAPPQLDPLAGLREAVLAGIGFGGIFLLLDATTPDSGLFPLVPLKIVSATLVAGAAIGVGRGLRSPPGLAAKLIAIGLLDTLATAMYLLATRRGLLSLVAVVSSLYPAGTVLLARVVLDERLTRSQVVAMGVAAVGVTLIALG